MCSRNWKDIQVAENHSCDVFSPIESDLETLRHEFPGCNSSVVSQLLTPTARSPYLEYGLSILWLHKTQHSRSVRTQTKGSQRSCSVRTKMKLEHSETCARLIDLCLKTDRVGPTDQESQPLRHAAFTWNISIVICHIPWDRGSAYSKRGSLRIPFSTRKSQTNRWNKAKLN